MSECPIHTEMDRWSGGLNAQTLRCAHAGTEYIHERWWPHAGRRWLNRTDYGDLRHPPELASPTTQEEADRIWTEMERRMLDGEPFGQPY